MSWFYQNRIFSLKKCLTTKSEINVFFYIRVKYVFMIKFYFYNRNKLNIQKNAFNWNFDTKMAHNFIKQNTKFNRNAMHWGMQLDTCTTTEVKPWTVGASMDTLFDPHFLNGSPHNLQNQSKPYFGEWYFVVEYQRDWFPFSEVII